MSVQVLAASVQAYVQPAGLKGLWVKGGLVAGADPVIDLQQYAEWALQGCGHGKTAFSKAAEQALQKGDSITVTTKLTFG